MANTLNATYATPKKCETFGCEASSCFYCGNPLSQRHEHDHYPVPQRAGGNHLVSVCCNCHDLKDRMRVADWAYSAGYQGMADLMTALGLDPVTLPEHLPDEALLEVLRRVVRRLDLHKTDEWASLSTVGRLLFAKVAAVMTGDCPAGSDDGAAFRFQVMADWVDRDADRYSDEGPTTRDDAALAREYRLLVPVVRRSMARLHGLGESVDEIAATFGVGRDTVYRVIRSAAAEGSGGG